MESMIYSISLESVSLSRKGYKILSIHLKRHFKHICTFELCMFYNFTLRYFTTNPNKSA